VQSANAEGVAIMDLQPKNIMIERDLTVRLIDLEGARPIMCESRDVLGTPGFMPLRRCSNRERDAYSLFQVLLYMFAPSLDSVLSPGLEQKRIDFISETFSEEVLNLIEHVRAELSSSVTKPDWVLVQIAQVRFVRNLCNTSGSSIGIRSSREYLLQENG
jgi:lanthionine synthetase C-like protein